MHDTPARLSNQLSGRPTSGTRDQPVPFHVWANGMNPSVAPIATQLVVLTHETECIESLVSDGVLGITDHRCPFHDSKSACVSCRSVSK